MPAPEAVQHAKKAHLRRIDGARFAFYDPFVESVLIFQISDVSEDGATFTPLRGHFIGDDAETADLPVLGIDVSEDRDVLVARVGMVRGTPGTHLTLYGMNDPLAKQSAFVDRPWNLMLREEGRIRGVVLRDGVGLDSVGLHREK